MLYHSLKIFHIISAALLITSLGYSYWLWQCNSQDAAGISQRIQTQMWVVIIPFAILQLLTGFTLISLKQVDLTERWVSGSVMGFIVAIASWFGFIYFLLSSRPNRSMQRVMLCTCFLSLLTMIFLMTNQIT